MAAEVAHLRETFHTQLDQLTGRMPEDIAKLRKDLLARIDAARWNTLDRLNALAPAPETLTCTVCEHTARPEDFVIQASFCIFGGGRLIRYGCPACDTIFGPLKVLNLPPEELAFEYSLLYAYYSEGDTTEAELRTFQHVHPKPGGVYLNYGAGAWSSANALLRKQGYVVYSYEPFVPTPADFAIVDPAQLATLKFDGIFSNNVLEHFPDPVGSLRFMSSLLKESSSLMAHATPCYDYDVHFTRFHVHFFPGRSVGVLASRAGLLAVHADRDAMVYGPYICHVFRRIS